MKDLGARMLKLFPNHRRHWEVSGDRLVAFDAAAIGRAAPTDDELNAVDMVRDVTELNRARQILLDDVPDAWKDSASTQLRIAWAMKTLFREIRQELKDA